MQAQTQHWTAGRKLWFRFSFLYLVLIMDIFSWLGQVPGVGYVANFIQQGFEWLVHQANKWFLHIKEELVMPGGSGDTSFNWAQVALYVILAVVGCIIWSLLDRKRTNYVQLNYWLCTALRFFVAYMCFLYGIDKLFLAQMPFPNNSQLATPLGDFLPMRLSWMFMGYSSTYQFFAGLMEVLAGLFLLFRKTITLGVVTATGVFINVMMMNLSYDIPVKIFSIHLVLMCLYLLSQEAHRLLNFFIYNKPAIACDVYHPRFNKKLMRFTRIGLKLAFLIVAIGLTAWQMIGYYKERNDPRVTPPLLPGIYEVTEFIRNHDTLPALITDTIRWQDLIIDNSTSGSIKTTDTSFRRRYERAYFSFTVDSAKQTIGFKKRYDDSTFLYNARFLQPDSNTIIMHGLFKTDSLIVTLKKSKRHFQLAERQFHWLSEANR